MAWGSLGQQLKTIPNAAASVQLILAWATFYDENGKPKPASNDWVANGYNWTGYFWSWGFSFPLPVPPFLNLVGSYFQSVAPFDDKAGSKIWSGFSLGVGKSAKVSVKSPFIKLDLTKLLSLKNLSGSASRTEYGLMYGNGKDMITSRGNKDINGLHFWRPVNQNDYPIKP